MEKYFKDLFTATEAEWNEVVNCVPKSITVEQNKNLLKEVDVAEVKRALFHMHPDKSPGPDGMSPGFYHKHWISLVVILLGRCKNFLKKVYFLIISRIRTLCCS